MGRGITFSIRSEDTYTIDTDNKRNQLPEKPLLEKFAFNLTPFLIEHIKYQTTMKI